MGARDKWQAAQVAEHYARGRFRDERARSRDERLIAALWRRHGPQGKAAWVLDLPSGTGRLQPALSARARRYLGADVSGAMLRQGPGDGLLADAAHLPFADDSFEVVVCCRLLHHLEPQELADVTRELLRVSRGLLIASFWDAATWPGLRRRLGLRRDETGRRALAPRRLEECLRRAGGEVLGYARSFPLLSMQTFVAVRPRGARR